MKKLFFITPIVLLLSSLLVYAQGLDGKWKVTDMKVRNDEQKVGEMEDLAMSMVLVLAKPAYFTFDKDKLIISDNEKVELESNTYKVNGDKIEIKNHDAKIEKGTIIKVSETKLLLDFGSYQYEIQKM
ncbi:MAG: hypothetical protein BGO31_01310 [Bacteroidetes bacterium 43-16]|nr:MAG: hypothetical protein BGO31_01310 [Bacteroidetes bacterium 43-16]